MKHTPTPWFAVPTQKGNNFAVNINPTGGFCITTIKTTTKYADTALADGKFITQACNCHEGLVEACNYALEQIQRTFDITDQIHMPPGWLDADIGLNNARGSLQEVLAKATK